MSIIIFYKKKSFKDFVYSCFKTPDTGDTIEFKTPEKNPEHVPPMTPNTRKRKSRLADEFARFVNNQCATKDDQVEIITLGLKKLGILSSVQKRSQHVLSSGRKLTPLTFRKEVWDFWHKNSTPSTITSRPAKLRSTDIPRVQTGLDFVDTVVLIQQRNRTFYESNWHVVDVTFKELYHQYCSETTTSLSTGTFHALKPFYVRNTTTKDIEMCVCKKHLHARWGIQALITLANAQKIDLGTISNYTTFFDYLTNTCPSNETTYIDWSCTPSKDTVCGDISSKWNTLKEHVLTKDDGVSTVSLQHFITVETGTTSGKMSKRLKAVSLAANMKFVVDFISELLTKIINHRNHLKHYRSTIHKFKEHFDTIFIDIDFSENLMVPVKYEPQSLHWSHEQVTVHSGILKAQGKKSYHPYISDDRKHDQTFVHCVLENMLEEVDINPETYLIIESDNCSSQYKSSAHFSSIQEISNHYQCNIIRVFGIPEHGKGEVDHVGGIAKNTIRRAIAEDNFFENASTMVDYLNNKFENYTDPCYIIKEIEEEVLASMRRESQLKVFRGINGSSKFQVMLFQPNATFIKAATRLCLCEQCKTKYGSCSIFQEYPLQIEQLKKVTLRSTSTPVSSDSGSSDHNEFILPGSICALAADQKSPDTVWFIKIDERIVPTAEMTDDYGHKVIQGQVCFKGRYLEKDSTSRKEQSFKLMNKFAFFFKDNVVYPFVNFTEKKDLYVITNNDFCDVISYVEHYGMSVL